tara:strand:+ start:8865 stop:9206 length:342 start_codon:yes stop_codon:yes gene_type:complete
MDIHNSDFSDSILTEYLDAVINNDPLEDVILKLTYKLQIFKDNGETQLIEAIDKNKIDYIILVTKLATMVTMFNKLCIDDNLVMVDYLKDEIEKFQSVMTHSIAKTNKELIDK